MQGNAVGSTDFSQAIASGRAHYDAVVQRLLATAVITGLLVATAAAFAITEKLKLTKSPITGTRVIRSVFSPPAGTAAMISVRFRSSDKVTATIDNSRRETVATLGSDVAASRGRHAFIWSGLTDSGAIAPDGTYYLRLQLAKARRTILLPDRFTLDTTVPKILNATSNRLRFSPDHDGQADTVTVTYSFSKMARALVFVDSHRVIRSRVTPKHSRVQWNGKVKLSGAWRLLPAGSYTLTVAAEDIAGNRTPSSQDARIPVVIRYITLVKHQVTEWRGGHLKIGVSTDAKQYRWRLGARSGIASGHVLRLRLQGKPGRYRLIVSERGHSDWATVNLR
jgi:FlgD Ig-like domain